MIRTQGAPLVTTAGKPTTLSSTITSGPTSAKISRSRGSTYQAPSTRACQVGAMNVSSWLIVGFRNSGAVSRMKSFQNWPGTSGSAGGGPRRIRRSSKPWTASRPANDSSTTKTTRWPRRRRTSPIPTQLLVGPYAPSGKKTMVFGARSVGPLSANALLLLLGSAPAAMGAMVRRDDARHGDRSGRRS
jgi:hypothetical protein